MIKIPITKRQHEVVLYLIFGGLTTLVNFALYAFFVQLVGVSVSVSNLIAWVIAVAFAFVTNKLWVFRSKSWEAKKVSREAGAFIGARIVTGLIDIIGVPLLFYIGLSYPLFGIEGFAAKTIVGIVVIILNYVFSRVFVFRPQS